VDKSFPQYVDYCGENYFSPAFSTSFSTKKNSIKTEFF